MCAHSMKTYRVVDIFTLQPLYPWRKKLKYPLNSRLGGPHSRLDALVNGNIPCPCWESRHDSSAWRWDKLIYVTDTCVP